jgi:hypothetical protein
MGTALSGLMRTREIGVPTHRICDLKSYITLRFCYSRLWYFAPQKRAFGKPKQYRTVQVNLKTARKQMS